MISLRLVVVEKERRKYLSLFVLKCLPSRHVLLFHARVHTCSFRWLRHLSPSHSLLWSFISSSSSILSASCHWQLFSHIQSNNSFETRNPILLHSLESRVCHNLRHRWNNLLIEKSKKEERKEIESWVLYDLHFVLRLWSNKNMCKLWHFPFQNNKMTGNCDKQPIVLSIEGPVATE